jgi:hypothetical protein
MEMARNRYELASVVKETKAYNGQMSQEEREWFVITLNLVSQFSVVKLKLSGRNDDPSSFSVSHVGE